MIHRERASAAVTVLRLDHGPVSVLDTELLEAFRAELSGLAAEGCALVLTGTGGAFSAGVDLYRLLDGGEEYMERFLPALSGAFEDLFSYPRPVVAAVNGHAIAGGCVLACAGDYRLMAEGEGRIGVTELLVGVPFPAMGLGMLRFATADRGVQEMLYRGATWLPEEAKARGLVDEVVPAGLLLERALGRAEQLAAIPPATFWHTKRALRGPVIEWVRKEGAGLDAEMEKLWRSPEVIAAIAAFVRKTLGERSSRANGERLDRSV